VARIVDGVASYIFMKIFDTMIKLGQGITSEPQVTSLYKICAKTMELTNASFSTGEPVEGKNSRTCNGALV
jgi:hypothetical protein